MAKFSRRSKDILSTCDDRLQVLFNEVVKYYDCSILCGFRNKNDQNDLYLKNLSKLQWPDSKHNMKPSLAVDVVPYFAEKPHVRWDDYRTFIHFGGFVRGVASQMRIGIKWGGDWDCDFDMKDQTFIDYPHFEIIH